MLPFLREPRFFWWVFAHDCKMNIPCSNSIKAHERCPLCSGSIQTLKLPDIYAISGSSKTRNQCFSLYTARIKKENDQLMWNDTENIRFKNKKKVLIVTLTYTIPVIIWNLAFLLFSVSGLWIFRFNFK